MTLPPITDRKFNSDGRFVLSPRSTVRFLLCVIAGLLAASIVSRICFYYLGYRHLAPLLNRFYIDTEASLPTWYSSITLLLCSVLLWAIGWNNCREKAPGDVRHWWGLSCIFLLLSIDEAIMLHEVATVAIRKALGLNGALRYSWVLLGAAFAIGCFLAYFRFLLSLPARFRRLFCLAGGIYLSGALGAEMVSAWYVSSFGRRNFGYTMVVTGEEALEMLGVLLFIYALLTYINHHCQFLNRLFVAQRQ